MTVNDGHGGTSTAVNVTVAVVLAGGQASRMGGGDKCLLEIGGRPILARVLDALRTETPLLAINANGDPARFARFDLPVLPDPAAFAGQGPLAGLLAALDWAATLGTGSVLTAPGDTPFLPRGLLRALSPAPAHAASGGRDHPLLALWPVSCREPLRAMLRLQSGRAVRAFGEVVGIRRVEFATGALDPFLNVNTPEDLAAAREVSVGSWPLAGPAQRCRLR